MKWSSLCLHQSCCACVLCSTLQYSAVLRSSPQYSVLCWLISCFFAAHFAEEGLSQPTGLWWVSIKAAGPLSSQRPPLKFHTSLAFRGHVQSLMCFTALTSSFSLPGYWLLWTHVMRNLIEISDSSLGCPPKLQTNHLTSKVIIFQWVKESHVNVNCFLSENLWTV